MTEFYVSLHSMGDVKKFVTAASLSAVDIDVCSGRYTVDAKSILGICSLELERPVQVKVYGGAEDGAAFREDISDLMVQPPEE